MFDELTTTILEKYPKLEAYLFSDMGAKLQSLEGSIAISIMLEGVKRKIPVLPIHDSFAVQKRYESWLKGTMKRVWSKNVGLVNRKRIYPALSVKR